MRIMRYATIVSFIAVIVLGVMNCVQYVYPYLKYGTTGDYTTGAGLILWLWIRIDAFGHEWFIVRQIAKFLSNCPIFITVGIIVLPIAPAIDWLIERMVEEDNRQPEKNSEIDS